jgi:transcriptional regulator with XRE-family HTH domain
MQDKELFSIIGNNITKYRKQKGLTIKEFGYLCDIEKPNLIPIEKGKKNITLSTLNKIANSLEVEITELLKD